MQCICREFFFLSSAILFVVWNVCVFQFQKVICHSKSRASWNCTKAPVSETYSTEHFGRSGIDFIQQHVFTLKWMKSYQRLNFLGILSVFLLLHGYYSIFGCHEFYWITATRFNPCHIVTLFTDRRCCCCTGNHLKLSFIVKLFIPCHHPSGEIPSRVLLSKTGMVSLLVQERKIMKPSQGLWCLCTQKSNVLSVYDV